mmetsp:Transcript_9666/g.27508  ORF Transcript_9666/g.27508 Transcript_9666/m.27508 type:complete len:222 (-) Transcript_9666:9-674(-)
MRGEQQPEATKRQTIRQDGRSAAVRALRGGYLLFVALHIHDMGGPCGSQRHVPKLRIIRDVHNSGLPPSAWRFHLAAVQHRHSCVRVADGALQLDHRAAGGVRKVRACHYLGVRPRRFCALHLPRHVQPNLHMLLVDGLPTGLRLRRKLGLHTRRGTGIVHGNGICFRSNVAIHICGHDIHALDLRHCLQCRKSQHQVCAPEVLRNRGVLDCQQHAEYRHP